MMENKDKIMYKLGYVGILLAAFCWGWNNHHFK